MSNLEWREVTELHLTDRVVQDPNSTSLLMQDFLNVRVAIDGAFLHIDARRPNERDQSAEYTVHTVPASAVKVIRFRAKGSEPQFFSWAEL